MSYVQWKLLVNHLVWWRDNIPGFPTRRTSLRDFSHLYVRRTEEEETVETGMRSSCFCQISTINVRIKSFHKFRLGHRFACRRCICNVVSGWGWDYLDPRLSMSILLMFSLDVKGKNRVGGLKDLWWSGKVGSVLCLLIECCLLYSWPDLSDRVHTAYTIQGDPNTGTRFLLYRSANEITKICW